MSESVAADELKQFVERIEAQTSMIADEKDILKDIFAEIKSRGYDCKIVRMIVKDRKRKADDIAEEQAVLDMYKSALGMV